MALITSMERINKEGRVHRSTSECSYFVVNGPGGKKYLTIETYGSAERQIPGKISQTLQLDEEIARKLKALIEETFPEL